MTIKEKAERKAEIMEGIKPELRTIYSALVDMLVELESKIATLQKTHMMNKKLQTIAPEAQLYKQLTTQYVELHKELVHATVGTTSETALDAFFARLMEEDK